MLSKNLTQLARKRIVYALIILIVIILGLISRHLPNLPVFINSHAGDTLWALMFFLMFAFVFLKTSTFKIAAATLLFSFCIELSQFYHAPWIDNIRQTFLGSLVLGHRFVWIDLVRYSVGVAIGVGGEMIWLWRLSQTRA